MEEKKWDYGLKMEEKKLDWEKNEKEKDCAHELSKLATLANKENVGRKC